MGYLFQILLAIGAQSLVEAGVGSGWRLPWLVLLACALPHLLARAALWLSLRGRARSSAIAVALLRYVAVLAYLFALAVCGWQDTLQAALGRPISGADWPEPALLLVAMPFVVYEVLAIDARSRILNPAGDAQRAWRSFQLRMFLSGLLPIAVYVLFTALIGTHEGLRASIEGVALYQDVFAAVLLLALAACLPFLLRNTWETVPLSDPLQRELLGAVARKARFEANALLVWNTGQQVANAAIVGVGRRGRVVLFSDLLLSQLSLRELASVFAHEIGHAARHHVPIFALWAIVFFLGADLLVEQAFDGDPWLSGAAIAALAGVWYASFGYMSRRFELDADLFSLELLGDPTALIGALERVGGHFRDIASWRHFSTAQRVQFIERAALDPAQARGLRRNLRVWTLIGGALFLGVLALRMDSALRSFDADRIGVDLRLGRYAAAHERAQAAGELDPALRDLVERARALGTGADAVELARSARAALLEHDAAGALAALELGGLRGDAEMEAAADALRASCEAVQGDADGAPARPPGVALDEALRASPEAWRADLAACFTAAPRATR